MSPAELVAIITAGVGLAGGVFAGVRSLMERPKVRADAVKTITEAAASTVTSIDSRMQRLETRLEDTERELSAALRYHRRVWAWWQRHQAYDAAHERRAAGEHSVIVPMLEPFPMFDEDLMEGETVG